MMDSEGNRLQGAIDEVKENTIVMNFNHPLAGASLHFSGKVEEIREATETELTNGLFNEKVSSCGGGCSTAGDCSSCGCGGCH
jgi:FKBP-type peptidyl-prolyl cis-trans isomerase SlyD